MISIVDGLTVKSSKALWAKIMIKFASQTVTNRGPTWVHWECLKFTGNIEEYIKECSNILFDIAGIGISLPPDIMAYSILGKISRDSSQYDHIINSMVLSMNSNINPQQVLDKLSELLRHKNSKRDAQKTPIKEENDSSALLTASDQFPYKLTYICKNSKHNIKNTTHKAKNCWAEHPELRPPPQNRYKRKTSEGKTHQTGMEALFTTACNPSTSPFSLVIDCGATHHMFNNRSLFSNFSEINESISTSDPSSNLMCKGQGTVKIIIDKNSFTLLNCLFVPKLTKNLVSLLDLCKDPITIARDNSTFQLSQNDQTFLSGQLINKLMVVFFNQPMANLTESPSNPPWHLHLGHPSNQVLKSLGLKPIDNNSCDTCTRGKMTALPFKGHFVEVTKPLDCLHLDVVGPISPPSKSGHPYFLTIVDQYTSFKIVRFLK
ncbi:hypothetical protein O181_123806, partial [Austropuccinia psidii MF-1]|nr:hypothetical protein [Austropuccinia psidii MF-1]